MPSPASPTRPLPTMGTRNRGRLAGPARGGGKSIGGFHGPKKSRGPTMPWGSQGNGGAGAGIGAPMGVVDVDDVEDVMTIAS
jgi:hypothetical protein